MRNRFTILQLITLINEFRLINLQLIDITNRPINKTTHNNIFNLIAT